MIVFSIYVRLKPLRLGANLQLKLEAIDKNEESAEAASN
jgi:hypothetical protein